MTIIFHLLFLMITDLLPALTFLWYYLPRVQAVVGSLMNSSSDSSGKNKKRIRKTYIAGNDLLFRYTVRTTNRLSKRK